MITSFLHLRQFNRTRVFYLHTSSGLSLNCASEKIPNCSAENIDIIVNLFRAHGLTNTQITSIISLKPSILIANPVKTIKPNMKVLASLKISGPELVKMAIKVPNLLESRVKEVVEIMKEYNFTNIEISAIAKKLPSVFMVKLDSTLRPKLEYFKSSGLSDEEVRKLLSSKPGLLKSSLQRTIIPAMEVLREYLGESANVVRAIRGSLWNPKPNTRETVQRNFELLKSHGVPSRSITKASTYTFFLLLMSEEKLKKGLKEVIKLGINPTNTQFMVGLRVMISLTQESREKKLSLYRSFGLGDEDMGKILRCQPLCMKVSEKKIEENLDFFINRLKMNPSFFGKYPCTVQLNMKKRILGRCAVMEILVKKGLVKTFKIGSSICYSEKRFSERIIGKYKNEAPEIMKAHRGLIAFNGFPDGFVLT